MIRVAMILALLAPSAPAAEIACGPEGAPAGAVELREAPVPVIGFGDESNQMPYVSFLVPAAWKDDGRVTIDPSDPCGVTEKIVWRAASPDGSSSIEVTPGAGWTASARPAQFSACLSRDLHDAAGYGAALLSAAAPAATVTATRDRADIAEPIREQVKSFDGYAGKVDVSAFEIAFEARPADGTIERGLLISAMTKVTPHPSIPEYEALVTAFPSLLARTRGGTPDAALVEMVRSSAIANPNWVKLRERIFAPPGLLPDPRQPLSRRYEPVSFPEREPVGEATACGRRFARLKAADAWRSDDNRFWFSTALTAALEPRR